MSQSLYLALGLGALALLAGLNLALFVSLGRQGDERRRMIVQKASAHTLCVLVAYLVLCVVEDFVRGAFLDLAADPLNPFVLLTVIAMVYFAHLLYYKRKFGG